MEISYKVIPKDIIKINGNNSLVSTYVYSLIKYYENFNTNISEITESTISQFANIDISTTERIIKKLKTYSSLFAKVETIYKQANEKKNYYHFYKSYDNYFYIDNNFFKKPLKNIDNNNQTICKGFLLRLKAICQNNTNIYWNGKKLNKTKLAEKMGISRPTLNKYLDILIKSNNIKLLDNGELFINNIFIVPDYISSDNNTLIYHTIFNYCISNNSIPPIRNDKYLYQIYANYYLHTNEYLKEINKIDNTITDIDKREKSKQNIRNIYLPYILSERCQKLPDKTTYQYLFKILLNKKIEKELENEFIYILE